jgi:hypothetical protein
VNAIHEQSTAHMVGLPASQNWLGGGGARRRAARDPASWSTCLWGGLFNPIIPIEDRDFSDKLIRTFGVSDHAALWNGRNIRPRRPHFSTSHHDVVASYTDGDTGATASFGFPDRPFDDEDPEALNQHFVVTVDANQYGPRRGFGHLNLAIVSHGLARKCSLDAWRHDRGHASVAAGRAAGKSRRRRTARRPARPVAIRKAGDQASGALARMAPLAASTPSSLGNSASSPSCSRVVASLVARHLLLRPEVAAACWARLGVCSRDERSVY